MAASRPAKDLVRTRWVEHVHALKGKGVDDGQALYLTMCGASGTEIDLLVEAEVVRLTQVGSIHEEDADLIVAIESSGQAELELKRRFPGLKVVRKSIQELLRSGKPWAWPEGSDEQVCRALAVNLDLDKPLTWVTESGQLVAPIVDWIARLADVHAKPPVTNWTLFLTLHGAVTWPEAIDEGIRALLLENFNRRPTYAGRAEAILGPEIYRRIQAAESIDWANRERKDHQHYLMALVPKKIGQLVHSHGWFVETVWSLRYGGANNTAPMVTWMFTFSWDTRATMTPDAVYLDILDRVLGSVGCIDDGGQVAEE